MTTETVLSIRLKTEFAAAKADIEGLREKVRGMTEAARAGGAEAGRSAAGIAQLAESWLGVRSAVDPVAAATHRFEQAEKVADAAVAAGIATKAEALQLLDAWAAKLDMVASKASAADALADFNGMKAGLDQAYAASLRLAEGQRIVAAAVQAGVVSEGEAARMLDLLATRLDMVGGKFGTLKAQADLDSLRAGLDPAYAASLQLAQGQEVLRAALAASAVEEAESTRLLDLLAARLDMVGGKFGVARVTAEFEALRASIDPAYAATLRFAQAQEVANAAVSAGVTTQAQATQTLDVMAQKLGLAQGQVGKLGLAAQGSAMHAGNLAAQWNDVAMMIMAGQNPMMLAIQQGTQITQVMDQMRASGAGASGVLGMLKSSVMSLINPMNLVVYAAIAAGAAIVQWMMSSGEEVKTLEDRITDLSAATRDYAAAVKAAGQPIEELTKKYGALADEVLRALEAQRAIKRDQAEASLSEILKASGFDMHGIGRRDAMRAQLNEMRQAMLDTQAALTPTSERFFDFSADYVAFDQLRGQIEEFEADLEGVANQYGITIDQAEQLAMATEKLRQAQTDTDKTEAASDLLETMTQVFGSVEAADKATHGMAAALVEAVKSGADIATAMKQAGDEADKTAAKITASYEEELAKQQDLASIRAVIARYGEDSAQAANAQATAARKAYQAEQEAAGQAGVHLDNLMKAWDAAQGVASVDLAGNVTLAANEAARMAGNLMASLAAMANLRREAVANANRRQESARIDLETVGNPVERAARHDVSDYRWSLPDGGYSAISSPSSSEDIGTLVEEEGMVRNAAEAAAQMAEDATAADAAWTKLITGKGAGGGGGGGTAAENGLSGLKAQATEALTGLDTAIAAIHEKVAAGLMTAAEAAQAVASAKDQAAGSLAELIAKLDRLGPAGQAAAQDIRAQMRGIGADLKASGTDLSKELSEGFKGPFAAFLSGAQPAKDAMNDFADHVKAKLAEIAAQEMQLKVITPLMDKAFSWAGSIFKFADGGAPDAPALAAHRNQVLDRPTLFPMARGRTGLMAEAGAEAIMPVGDGGVLAMFGGRETRLPLARGAGGRLGVDLGRLADRAPLPFALGGVPDGSERLAAPKVWRPEVLDRAPVAFARGGVVDGGGGLVGADAAALPGRAAAQGAISNTKVDIHHYGPGPEPKVSERIEGNTRFIEVIVGEVEKHLGGAVSAGRGALHDSMVGSFGLTRAVR